MRQRVRYTEAEWYELICQCKASGLSDHEWLKQNNIPESTFYKKMKLLSSPEAVERNAPTPKKSLPEVAEKHDIVQVSFKDESKILYDSQGTDRIAVTLHIGPYSLDIHNHAETELIRNTLLILKSLC